MRFKKLALFAALSLITGAAIAADKADRAFQAVELMDIHKDVIIIDVRTKDEFKEEHFEGAKNISLSDLPWNLDKFEKDAKIILYCRSGVRSSHALNLMVDAGFLNVLNAGGLNDLKKAKAKYERLNQKS